jgi:hypothetical protein
MDTKSCPTCRSVNHANLARCMNCGSTMELVSATAATDGSIAPPPPAPGSYGWSAIVAQAPPTPRRRPWAAIAFGVIVILAFIALLVLQLTVDPSDQATRGQLTAIWLVSLPVGFAYWSWMLFDAFTSRRIGWAVAIFFLGTVGGLAYALLAMSPPSVRRD